MDTFGWRSRRSVIEQLAAEPWRFDVHQAVRLIESQDAAACSLGDGSHATNEAIRFRSSLTSAFPASDLSRATPPHPGEPRWELEVNFLGLAGAFGPLPAPFTESVVRLTRSGDTATRDFLDIFNHRLVSLLHRIRRKHRPALTSSGADAGPIAQYLYALAGLGTPSLRGRMAVDDRALLGHAALISQKPASLHGLERLLAAHFGVSVRVLPLQGRWLALDDTQTSRLGHNARLGQGAVLGSRVWDQQAAITVVLGPLEFAHFSRFLPGEAAWRQVRALIRFYTHNDVDVDLRLLIKADQVPQARLAGAKRLVLQTERFRSRQGQSPSGTQSARLGAGARLVSSAVGGAPRLGWTSWLTTRLRTEVGQVTLRGGGALIS